MRRTAEDYPTPQPMNLKELSKKLNLSQTTVSRALNGYPDVREATRQRVAEAAALYGYRPNLRARTLATGRSMSIGHIIPASRRNEIANVVFADFIAGAGSVYAAHGYTMALTIVEDDKEMMAYRGIVERGAVDGVVLQCPTRQDPRIAHLCALRIPFVVHGRASDIGADYAWLDVNNSRAMDRATQHLIDLGHRRIAFVNGEERMDFAYRRRAGYLAALSRAGLDSSAAWTRAGEMTEPQGYSAAREMLASANAPTAFVASSIVLAMGIQRAVLERGLTPGRDISIVCFDDDISYFPNRGPGMFFTSVKSSVRAAGARCAELLINRIKAPEQPLAHELWEAELVIGTTTGPAPAQRRSSS